MIRKPSRPEAIRNSLTSELNSMILEHEHGVLDKESILTYFSAFLIDADVDSRIVVDVLEKFGDMGKDQALAIKINEGW